MSGHAVHLFCCVVKIGGLTTFFVSTRAGFSFVVWPLHGILGGVILQHFTLFYRVPGVIQQACFTSGRPIARMTCIYCLALASAACFGVGGRGGFSSLSFPAMTGTVGICPNWSFRNVSTLIYFSATSILSNSSHIAL